MPFTIYDGDGDDDDDGVSRCGDSYDNYLLLKIRPLIFNIGIPILVRRHLYLETPLLMPWAPSQYKDGVSRYGDSYVNY